MADCNGNLEVKKYFFKWAIPGLFSLFLPFLKTVYSECVQKELLMTGFEPWSSGIESDCAVNCNTTTSQVKKCYYIKIMPL